MRIFPCAARPRVTAAAAALVVVMGAWTVPGLNPTPVAVGAEVSSSSARTGDGDDLGDRLKHRKNQVEHRVRSIAGDLDESSDRLRQTTQALETAQTRLRTAKGALGTTKQRLAAARAGDRELQTRLEASVDRLRSATGELVAGRHAVAGQRDVLADTVTSIYEEGDPRLLAFASMLSAGSPDELTVGMEFKNVVIDKQTFAYDDLRAARVSLRGRRDAVAEAKDEVAVQRQQARAHLVETERLHDGAVSAKEHVREVVDVSRDVKHEANSARKHDLGVLARLKKQEDAIALKIRAAARRAAAADPKGGFTGTANGYLLPPVTGPVTSPYGYRIHPIYGYYGLHDGTDFGVSCGEGMRAASDGVVTQAYYSPVNGNRLYLDVGRINGHAVTVIYNHATGYRVGVGERVQRGEIVGYVGSTGWSTGCHLHFTVLVDGTAVDPMSYL